MSLIALVELLRVLHPDTWCRVDYPGSIASASQVIRKYGAESAVRGDELYVRALVGGGEA